MNNLKNKLDIKLLRSSFTRFALATLAIIMLVSFSTYQPALAGNLLQATSTPQDQLDFPTPTATEIGGATATPSRTPTFPVVLVEAVDEANLRDGPGLGFDLVGTLTSGNPVPVIGRSPNFPWYVIEWENAPNGVAYVFNELVFVQGDITTVPIYPDPALPTIDPTQAAIQATATVLLQTPGAAETATASALFQPTGIFTSTPAADGTPSGDAQAEFAGATPSGGSVNVLPDTNQPNTGGIPPGLVILTLGGIGFLALILSLLRG